jgi:hypothetical protein
MSGDVQSVIVAGLVGDVADLREGRVPALEAAVKAQALQLEEHERADQTRHREVMEILPTVRDLLEEVRDGQRRTVAAWVAELGADAVTLPVIGATKVRTLVVLVALGLGSLTWLGISGESVWAWWTGQGGAP